MTGRFEDCSSVVIGACIEVHRVLGPRRLAGELSCRNYPSWPPSPHAQSTQPSRPSAFRLPVILLRRAANSDGGNERPV
jgi:hypothetical protein